jgi:voltage-gated potassium channel
MPRQRTPAPDDASADLYFGAQRRLVEWVSGKPRRRLFTAAEGSPVRRLVARLVLVLLLVGVVTATYWVDRDGLRDQIDGEISFVDVLYFTMVTITTVGYGDIVPISDRARLIDTFLVAPIRLFIWLIFLGTAYQFVIQKTLEDFRMARLQKRLSGHVIICGFGHSGQTAARELVERGMAAGQILVIDQNESLVRRAAEEGHVGLWGDPTKNELLHDAAIGTASAVIISLGRDDTSSLTVLTARHLNPRVRIIATSRDAENIDLMKQAGADSIVSTGRIGGFLLADSVMHAHTADYVLDLLTNRGQITLIERAARADEVGRRMREIEESLVVRIVRDGKPVGIWKGDDSVIRPGDTLIVIEPSAMPKA